MEEVDFLALQGGRRSTRLFVKQITQPISYGPPLEQSPDDSADPVTTEHELKDDESTIVVSSRKRKATSEAPQSRPSQRQKTSKQKAGKAKLPPVNRKIHTPKQTRNSAKTGSVLKPRPKNAKQSGKAPTSRLAKRTTDSSKSLPIKGNSNRRRRRGVSTSTRSQASRSSKSEDSQVLETPGKLRAENGDTPKQLLTPPATGGDVTKRFKSGFENLGALPSLSTYRALTTEYDDQNFDENSFELSRKLTARLPLAEKPEAQCEPLVWADSRQALCETLPYFKMPQSGCHQNDHHVYAFLFDNVGHCREYMDTDVIIARAGGGMEKNSMGELVQKKDHIMSDSQVQAVLNDIKYQNPLIIICGNRNENALCKMPHRYCVLGWYKPIAVWAEKTLGKGNRTWTTTKYRFERLDLGKPIWHAPRENLLTDDERQSIEPLLARTCSRCRHSFPRTYLNGWMCLNPECAAFWKLDNGREAPYGKLDYDPSFLLHRANSWQDETEPYSVQPAVPDVSNFIGDNLTYINTRGICCPKCGKCNSRRYFKGWKCENPLCDFVKTPEHRPVKPQMLHNPWDIVGDGPTLARNKHKEQLGVKLQVEHLDGYKVYQYTFDGIEGKLIHAISNVRLNRQKQGADQMFAAIQELDLQLERRRFGISRQEKPDLKPNPLREGEAIDPQVPELDVTDGDFMTAFSMNYGMPYKFVASGGSRPFEGSPWPVRACRTLLNKKSRLFLKDETDEMDFNEELIFAYMEGQKIEYHDDGEAGLGPRIATLSLGGKAKMCLRMKMKHYVGCSKQGMLTSDRPTPHSIGGETMYQHRLHEWNQLEEIKHTDPALYQKRRKDIPAELGLLATRHKKAEDLVTLTLSHGDIVIMDGYDIQKYLEHKVVPEGYLRFALTCRTVLEDHLRPKELPPYTVPPDDGAEISNEELGEISVEADLGKNSITEEVVTEEVPTEEVVTEEVIPEVAIAEEAVTDVVT